MAIRKRNEFLEASDSEAEAIDHGYDSDAVEESKNAVTSRASKRRRTEESASDESASEVEGSRTKTERRPAGSAIKTKSKVKAATESDSRFANFSDDDELDTTAPPPDDDNNNDDGELDDDDTNDASSAPSKTPIPKSVLKAQKVAQKSGVIYISRVPPFMKPQTLRHFLAPHAPKGLGRIFLTPEDHVSHTRRVKNGGNKKKSFVDGWIEFISKRDAKNCAEALNGNIIGGKKGNFYHDDMWTMKYLQGFKWRHLTEQITNENAEREARMREEIRKTREENRAFERDFEHGKMLETKERKKRAREGENAAGGLGKEERDRLRGFKQKSARDKEERAAAVNDSRDLQSVLSKIF